MRWRGLAEENRDAEADPIWYLERARQRKRAFFQFHDLPPSSRDSIQTRPGV